MLGGGATAAALTALLRAETYRPAARALGWSRAQRGADAGSRRGAVRCAGEIGLRYEGGRPAASTFSK